MSSDLPSLDVENVLPAPAKPKRVRKPKVLTEAEQELKELREKAKEAKRLASEMRAKAELEKAEDQLLKSKAQQELLAKARLRSAEIINEEAVELIEPTSFDEQLADTKNVEVAGKKFRLNNQRLFLTYKTHLDKAKTTAFFYDRNVKEVIIAHEAASSDTNYEHSHVYVDFGRNFQSTNSRVFDIASIHPNIKAIKSAKHLENIWAYLCKEDKENEYLLERLTTQTLFDKVSACKTIQDVMKMAKSPSDAMGLKTLYEFKPRPEVECAPLIHQWQIDLAEELRRERSTHGTDAEIREIIWYYDGVGKTGKSGFMKHMRLTDDIVGMTQFNGGANVAQNIKNRLEEGWNGRTVIIDLPRDAENLGLWSPLEQLKNGYLTATKYQGGDLIFNNPNVVVFANFWPQYHCMSIDRWDIRELITESSGSTRRVTSRKVPIAEAIERGRKLAKAKTLGQDLCRKCEHIEDKELYLENLILEAQRALKLVREDKAAEATDPARP